MVKQKSWVIYGLKCPLTKKIRYVGKTNSIKSRFKQHCADIGEETYKKLWISKLKSKGIIPELILLDKATTEPEARQKENENVIKYLSTVYNIFMPGKNTPSVHDFRIQNNVEFDCEFEEMKMKTDKYNKQII